MKTAYFNRFSVHLPDAAVADCHHPGDCHDDVARWATIADQNIDPAALRAELKEYGAWDDGELADHDANVRRIIWIAAGNIQEEEKAGAR